MTAVLVAISDVGLGRRYRVAGETLVGRHPSCGVQLVASQVSKHHARLWPAEGTFFIEDLGSLNGVYLNGKRLEQAARLEANDLLAIGDHAFIFSPDLEILPEDDGGRALILTGEADTSSATLHANDTAPAGVPPALLDLFAAGDPEALPGRLLEKLTELVRYDAAGLLAGDAGAFETVAVRGRRTFSIPRSLVEAALHRRHGLSVPDASGDTSFNQGKSVLGQKLRSVLVAPLFSGEALAGAICLTRDEPNAYPEEDLARLLGAAPVFAAALALRRQLALVQRAAFTPPAGDSPLFGDSPALAALRELVARAAPAPSPVLIRGETGSGKELVARELHRLSPRAKGPFVAVNCGAVPENLMESEFFGHERGAFSGAERQKLGMLELASGGTLLLDEIGELPPVLQVKLLRALEEKSFYRVGGVKAVRVDFRLVAATHRDLEAMVAEGRFRQDLFFRLNVLPLTSPPLRERREDITPLADRFLDQLGRELGRRLTFTAAAKQHLRAHSWPGNIRELRNLVERLVVLAPGPSIDAGDLGLTTPAATSTVSAGDTLPEQVAALEKERITQAMRIARGKKVDAARALGISRPTLDKKLKDYAIDIFEGDT